MPRNFWFYKIVYNFVWKFPIKFGENRIVSFQ